MSISLPRLNGMSAKEFGKRFFTRFMDNDLPGIAAELSYYFFFSLFPFLVFVVSLTAYLPLQSSMNELLGRLAMVMPKEAMNIIQENLNSLVNHPRPKLLSIGVLITIWSASRGMNGLITGLNIAYQVKDKRPYWKIQAIAIGMTLASASMLLLAFTLMVLGGKLGFYLAERLHVGSIYSVVGSWLRWPLSAFVLMLTMSVNYQLLPDVQRKFRIFTVGSIVGAVLWVLVTWGFTLYAEHFGNYNAAYGSIGGVIVLMTWLYLSGMIFLIGGELNALIECPDGGTQKTASPAAASPPSPSSDRVVREPLQLAHQARHAV
jgi:membrane protein